MGLHLLEVLNILCTFQLQESSPFSAHAASDMTAVRRAGGGQVCVCVAEIVNTVSKCVLTSMTLVAAYKRRSSLGL